MTRGRRNRGRAYAQGLDDDAAMTGLDQSHVYGGQNPHSNRAGRGGPGGGRRGGNVSMRYEGRSARRNSNTRPFAQDASEFGVVPPVEPPFGGNTSDSSGPEDGAPAAFNPFSAVYPHNANANSGNGHDYSDSKGHQRHARHASPRAPFAPHHGGGIPNRHCAECRAVRKTNLRLRDTVLQYMERARRVLLAWSSDVGVPFDFADDEMDWQPEPLIRVLLLPDAPTAASAASDGSGGGDWPPPCGGGGGSGGTDGGAGPRRESRAGYSPPGAPSMNAQQRIAAYMEARGLHPNGRPPLRPGPPPPVHMADQPPPYGSFPLNVHHPQYRPQHYAQHHPQHHPQYHLQYHPQQALPTLAGPGHALATAAMPSYGPVAGGMGTRAPPPPPWAAAHARATMTTTTTVDDYDEPD